jgi:hypothetical protein
MSINLNGFWQSWDVVSGNTSATNQYEFWKGMVMSNGQILDNSYDFFKYHNTTRYEWFKNLQGTYPEVWDEYTFYKNTNDVSIFDFKTFYEYGASYLVGTPGACSGSPLPGPCIATPSSVTAGDTVLFTLTNVITGSGISYLWESSPSGTAPWTNLGFNYPSYYTSVHTTTWYRCLVTCSYSGLTTIATPVQVIVI